MLLLAEMEKDIFDKVQESIGFIRSVIPSSPRFGLVLGTGLGSYADTFEEKCSISYGDIPNFPVSTVSSHSGRLIFGKKCGIPVIMMSGRFHYYEGYTTRELTLPVRVIKGLGADHLILTNAAGSVNPHYREGDLAIISDHINLMPDHPLRGHNDLRLGPRFPDMMKAYDRQNNLVFKELAAKMNLSLRESVYLALQGPSLETPAEYRMAHILGADLVGMSTVPEVIVARHEGIKVTAFSIVSNVCFPGSVLTETTLEEVIEVVGRSASGLSLLLDKYFETLAS